MTTEGNVYAKCGEILPTPTPSASAGARSQCRVYERCDKVTCPPVPQVCGERGFIRVRFQSGSGFYLEGNVANIPLVREDSSLNDEFTVDYHCNGITAGVKHDFKAISGTLTFYKDQNYRYLTVPILKDPENDSYEYFQIVLTNFKTKNANAEGDISVATHMGIIVDNECNDNIPVSNLYEEDAENCTCIPADIPEHPDKINIPWSADHPKVIKYNNVCYSATSACLCLDECFHR